MGVDVVHLLSMSVAEIGVSGRSASPGARHQRLGKPGKAQAAGQERAENRRIRLTGAIGQNQLQDS